MTTHWQVHDIVKEKDFQMSMHNITIIHKLLEDSSPPKSFLKW